jgi:signal transduction histidine kinase
MPEPTRVLLVDDSDTDRALARYCLQDVPDVDYAVTEADTAEAGLERLRGGDYDVVLLDWNLGSMDGLEVLRAARAAGSRVPVLMLTGRGGRDVDVAAMEAGAADYLPKSQLSPALLERAIRYAVNQAAILGRLEARTEELRRSNEDLERFASAVGHDLRNPMVTIAGTAELLGLQYKGRLDPRADHMLDRLIAGVTRLDHLISDLLAYARVNGPPVHQDEVSLDACLDTALVELEAHITATGAVVHRTPLPRVRGSRTLLTQVLANLLANALKFTAGRPPLVEVTGGVREDGWVEVRVRDHGRGIHKDDLERIFAVFQRGREVRETPGTGIGLAVCRRIAERHGGTVTVASEEGAGSTFRLVLPTEVG